MTSPVPRDAWAAPSTWIVDQVWYLHMWRFDPTVVAMLTMIDAIAQRFATTDPETVWSALIDTNEPAIWFQILPVSDMGAADDLYIKMNSRGKALTPFEAFKAHLGQVIDHTGRSEDFGERIDGPWTNLLWPHRGDDNIVDDAFMRFFSFLFEICEWREGRVHLEGPPRLERRAEALLGPANSRHSEHLGFIFDAFDRLSALADVDELFSSHFSSTPSERKVRLFGTATDPNLFVACCRRYGSLRGRSREFSLIDTQLLYAVLVHLIDGTEHVVERLRVLRNVNQASESEVRVLNMPNLVTQVADYMRTGDLSVLAGYNQNQIADERRKEEYLDEHPEFAPAVTRLEDHPILRGTLAAFTLDERFPTRSSMFEGVFNPASWQTLTGSLIATGEYQRDIPASDWHLFGSPTQDSVWRSLLVDRGDRDSLSRTGAVVEALIDDLSERGSHDIQMTDIIADFVARRDEGKNLDWRYYIAKYPWMREGPSGIYYGAQHTLGYEMTMLRKGVQRSYYRDPYLYAMWREANSPTEVKDPWFYGYSTTPRWMELPRSATGIRSVSEGIAVKFGSGHESTGEAVRDSSGEWVEQTDNVWLLRIPQHVVNTRLVDSQDRVVVGATLIARLIDAGC